MIRCRSAGETAIEQMRAPDLEPGIRWRLCFKPPLCFRFVVAENGWQAVHYVHRRMLMPRTRLGVIAHLAKKPYLTISEKPRMAIRDDFKGRTDWRSFLLHKIKRRFGQAEPLTSSRLERRSYICRCSSWRCLQSSSSHLGAVCAVSRVLQCRDPREATSWASFESVSILTSRRSVSNAAELLESS